MNNSVNKDSIFDFIKEMYFFLQINDVLLFLTSKLCFESSSNFQI